MYCPKCGQQASDNMRFCSRCGLQINEVAEWLSGSSGTLAAREEAETPLTSPKRKGMRRGAKVMFWGGVLLPIFFGLSIVFDEPAPLFIPVIIFLAGLVLFLYSRLFGEEASAAKRPQAQDALSGITTGQSALPPPSEAGAIKSGGSREARTAEMVQPPSVVDHTTKLLDRD
jgi:hypothetical protein